MDELQLADVKLKKGSKSFVSEKTLIQLMCDKIKTFPSYQELRHDLDFLEWVLSTIIQSLPSSKSRPIDAKAVCVSCYKDVFALVKPEELRKLEADIAYLHHRGIVRKASCIERIVLDAIGMFPKKK